MVETIEFHGPGEGVIKEVKVKPGSLLSIGKIILLYQQEGRNIVHKFKSGKVGKVEEILAVTGQELKPGAQILKLSGGCSHPTIMKDMCAECGADLRMEEAQTNSAATVSMVHAIPELKVSNKEAANIGLEDQNRLQKGRKLVLLVDLDQTLIHTTNDNIPPNLKDVYHFQLYGSRSSWYHTRIRPGTKEFLENISHLYEFHICTFGARLYAHTIAAYLDPEGKYFSHRILSRDECFDSRSKTANMSALFPCGDSMVCIIDDREDVWNFAPNLVHVKPYHFFKHTGDINAPPGLGKHEQDDKTGVDFSKIKSKKEKEEDTSSSSSSDDDEEVQEPKKKEISSVPNRRESVDMPKLIDENSNQGKPNGESKDADASAQKDASNCDISPAETDQQKQSSDDGKTQGEESVEDVNHDLELSDSEDSRDATNLKQKETDKKGGGEDKKKTKELEEVEDPDDYLVYLEDILKTVHKAYYDLYDQMSGDDRKEPDLKTVLPYVKRKVLQGVNIVFSGVVPTQIPLERSKPYLLAKSLGASVHPTVTRKTTHLVAAKLGTAKINDAKKQGCISICTPDWLWSCAERWERVDERLYPLGKETEVTRLPPAHCSSPEIAFAERCADIELNLDPGLSRQISVVDSDPFLAFSTEDIAGMDKEVEDILSGDSDSEDEKEDGKVSSEEEEGGSRAPSAGASSDGSLRGEQPRGHKRKSGDIDNDDESDSNLDAPLLKFQRGEEVPSDFEVENMSDDDDGGQEDWSLMGAELERELD